MTLYSIVRNKKKRRLNPTIPIYTQWVHADCFEPSLTLFLEHQDAMASTPTPVEVEAPAIPPSHVCLNAEGKSTCRSPLCKKFTHEQLKAYLQELSAFDFKIVFSKLFLYRFENILAHKREMLIKSIYDLERSRTYDEASVLNCVLELQELRADLEKADMNLQTIDKYLKAEFCEANSFQASESYMLTRYVRELISAYGTPHSLSTLRKYF